MPELRDFDYELPAAAIAQRPAPRGESRLLVVDAMGEARHRRVGELDAALLRPGDLVVVNDTRVIPARLEARRESGGRVELLLLERLDPTAWEALAGPGRKALPGARLVLGEGETRVEALVEARLDGGRRRLRFSRPLEPLLDALGHVPLPPYIARPDDAGDRERYQTVFAREPGAVAAPTAGLHFDAALLRRLEARGIRRAAVTLHVGLGTFRPMSATRLDDHRMESERYRVPPETAAAIAATRAAGGRVVAVGTTVVRTLETAAAGGVVEAGEGRSSLFIRPGHRFRAVDLLLTNFHLPRSTLLVLVAAFAGRERVLAAYREAIAGGYRFYSYGDAMLLEHRPEAGA